MTVANETMRNYKAMRKSGFQAKWALQNAKVLEQWESLNGVVVYESEHDYQENDGLCVRIVKMYDSDIQHMFDYDVDEGECKEKADKELSDLIDLHGCVGIKAEYFNGQQWVESGFACWGFIDNDEHFGGYVYDAMGEAMFALNEFKKSQPCRYG